MEMEELEDSLVEASMSLKIDVISSERIPERELREECFGNQPTGIDHSRIGSNLLGISGCHNYCCSFNRPNDLTNFLFEVERFCRNFEGDAHIRGDHLIRDLSPDFDSYHRVIEVHSFALGHWTGLSRFIKRFSSITARDGNSALGRICSSFFHDRRFMEIYFEDRRCLEKSFADVYKLVIFYDDIEKIVMKKDPRHLDAFHKMENKKDTMEVFLHVSKLSAYKWGDETKDAYIYAFDGQWDRVSSFGIRGGATDCRGIGAFKVLKFQLNYSSGNYPADIIYTLLRTSGAPAYFANVRTDDAPRDAQPLACEKASPEARIALACIHGLAPELAMSIALNGDYKAIQDLLTKLAAVDNSKLTVALYHIYDSLKNHSIIDMKAAVADAFQKFKEVENDMNIVTAEILPKNMFLVKKATVCPSRTFIEPPVAVRVNVLLNKLDPDKVMLVDIRDDDRKMLRCRNPAEAQDSIKTAIAGKINTGIRLAGKTYVFLGNCKDQMDNFSFWAYAIDKKKDPDAISKLRRELGIEGDLETRVAVQDMVFAEALGRIEIDPSWVSEEEDSPNSSDDFKLGIGRISKDALSTIVETCYPIARPCAAIRVIHGGRKGILAYDPSLEGNQIIYRKSQRVFASEDTDLYLIEINETKEAVFDKVFITTLSSKLDGHREEFSKDEFLAPVYELLRDCVSPFLDETAAGALPAEELLPRITQKVSSSPYHKRGDGVFKQAVRCRQLKALRDLKALKLRVKGAFELMVVVDEHNVLAEDEVFIQLSHAPTIMSSEVIIAPKIAMHPGQLVKAKVADTAEVLEKLGHLTNCVVIPSKGRSKMFRPLLSRENFAESSNVIVIANTSFIYKKNDSLPDASVPMESMVDPSCDIETHFFNYISYVSSNNFEEVFCALSDALDSNANSTNCLRVAKYRRYLEDYRRGGQEPARLQEPPVYPDFLGKISEKRTHCSSRPLGHVFRRVKFLDVGYFEETQLNYDEITYQTELNLKGRTDFDETVEADIRSFKRNLKILASMYRISVDELLTGTIFSLSEDYCSTERVKSVETTAELLVHHLASLCRKQFKKGMKRASEDQQLAKISAYYVASRNYAKDGGYAFACMLPDKMQAFIDTYNPEAPPPQETKLATKMLIAVPSEDLGAIEEAFVNNVSTLFGRWLNANKKICALTRADGQYCRTKLEEYIGEAFEAAFSKLIRHDGGGDSVRPIDPMSLMAEILREMISKSAESADQNFSSSQFFMMHIQTLLWNTLTRIVTKGSLDVLLKPKLVLRNMTVTHRILLPMGRRDDSYIRATHNDLPGYETKLKEISACDRVKVRSVPSTEIDEHEYEEYIVQGVWFSVANLEYVILQHDFRAIVLNEFATERRRNLPQINDE